MTVGKVSRLILAYLWVKIKSEDGYIYSGSFCDIRGVSSIFSRGVGPLVQPGFLFVPSPLRNFEYLSTLRCNLVQHLASFEVNFWISLQK